MIADRTLDVSLLAELMEGDAHDFLIEQCTNQGCSIHEYAEKLATHGTIAYDIIDGRMSGYVIGYTSDPKYTTSFITQVYVDRKYRGLHIASRLMEEYESFCKRKGLEGIWLTTQIDNYAAQNLYFRLGYVIVGFADDEQKLYKLTRRV